MGMTELDHPFFGEQVLFCKGVSSGYTKSNTYDWFTFVERIRASHASTGRSILNNTVINRFMTLDFKREASSEYVYEAPEISSQYLSVLCSGVQGDHSVIWQTDSDEIGGSSGVVNCDTGPNRQHLLSNYSSRLVGIINLMQMLLIFFCCRLQLNSLGPTVVGNYTCRSSLTGIFLTFTLSFGKNLNAEALVMS